MNKYPRITIVTPCFNHEKFIGETIESVVSQGYPNLEYIVINDGSTDNSDKEILKYKQYITKYEHWKGHRNSPVYSLNRAFKYATGDIYGWISSDDVLLKNSLFTVAKVFSELEEVEWVTGLASTINSRSEVVHSKYRPKHKLDFLVDNWKVIQQESTFFRESLLIKAGSRLNEDYIQAFDTELWTRFFSHAIHYNLNAPIGAFRKGGQSRSSRNIEEFLSYNLNAINSLKKQSKNKNETIAYSLLRKKYIKHIMSLLPISILKKIFSNGLYDVVNYNFEKDRWIMEKENPFKY